MDYDGDGGVEYHSVNDKPKERAEDAVSFASGKEPPKFDRDKVLKIALIGLGGLMMFGVIFSTVKKNIDKSAAQTASQVRRAPVVSVPGDIRGASERNTQTVELLGAPVQTGDEYQDSYETGAGYDEYSEEEGGGVPYERQTYVSAAKDGSSPQTSKMIPVVEGNGMVYGSGDGKLGLMQAGIMPGGNTGAGGGDSGIQAFSGFGGNATPAANSAAAAVMPDISGLAGFTGAGGYAAQNNQNDKQAFLNSGKQNGAVINTGYYLGEDTLWSGTVIPAVLVTGINTDLPGDVMARVSENVYDSMTGKHLLIPQGTVVMAKYNSSISYGQGRVQIVWNELTRPDGYHVNLGGMNGVDSEGRAGQDGVYSENLFQYLKAAGIITMFTMANAEVSRAMEADTANQDVIAANQAIISQLAGDVMSRALNIQPTITIKSGTKINVMLNKAVYFPPVESYKPVERYTR
jgi:type IV secretion system protein VirB10